MSTLLIAWILSEIWAYHSKSIFAYIVSGVLFSVIALKVLINLGVI